MREVKGEAPRLGALFSRDLAFWRRSLRLIAPEQVRRWLWIGGLVVLSALSSAVMVGSVFPFLVLLSDPASIRTVPALAWFYESFGFTSAFNFLVAVGLISLASIAISTALIVTRIVVFERFSARQAHLISHRLLGIYVAQPYERFLSRHTSDMSTAVLTEASQCVLLFLRPMLNLVAALATMIAIAAIVIWVDPAVALVALAIFGSIYAAIYLFARMNLRRIGAERVKVNGARFRIVGEVLQGIREVKLRNLETAYHGRFEAPSLKMADAVASSTIISMVPRYLVFALASGGVLILCLILLPREGFLTRGALQPVLPVLGVFGVAAQRLVPEFQKLYEAITQIQFGVAAVERILKDIEDPGIAALLPATGDRLRLRRSLELEDVTYRYPSGNAAGISGVSLSMAAGEKLGVVGSTGAGKSTLADVILGLLRPASGRISVDGQDVSPETLRAWQASVGYVPQDIFLMDASVAENIAFGVPRDRIDMEAVRRAADIASITAFVEGELEEGFKTPIGEKGVRLSGGQRQRIGIARALYGDADLIVFDEATSALDTVTERSVIDAIEALPGNVTVIVIAHRLSTLRSCDRILVLENGACQGTGTWDALMAENAVFQGLAGADAQQRHP